MPKKVSLKDLKAFDKEMTKAEGMMDRRNFVKKKLNVVFAQDEREILKQNAKVRKMAKGLGMKSKR